MAEPIRYRVELRDRVHHLVHVTLTVPADLAPGGRIVLSVWTPGSYVVRDYVHHLQRIVARTCAGDEVELEPSDGTAWWLPPRLEQAVEVELELYANDLTVRTNHVDDHHALLIPAATLPFVEGGEDRPHEVHLEPWPEHHRVFSLLPSGPAPDTYVARDRDHLIDSAFEVGDLPCRHFDVAGVPHTFVWAGHGGRPDLGRVERDVTAIAEASRALFEGDLPTERYTILTVGWDEGGGGLEHRDGAVLQIPVRVFQDDELYARFQSLVAHEYLHLWNVKRLVPAALVRPSYDRPTRTDSLWVAEGWTAYYDDLLPVRAGLWPASRLYDALSTTAERVRSMPGTALQSLRAASREAWTKHYVRDENSPNAMTDYYAHGALVAFELDLRLRLIEPDGEGIDAVLRRLWARHRESDRGYTEQDVLDAVARIGGDALATLVDHRVGTAGCVDLDDDVVSAVGLRWSVPTGDHPPELGAEVTDDDRGVVLSTARRDGPAWKAGVTGGDRIVAMDGRTVARGQLGVTLAAFEPGDTVELTVVRGPRLLTLPVTLGAARPEPALAPLDDPTESQRRAFRRWTGQAHPANGEPTVP